VFFRLFASRFELSAALGTGVEFEFDGLVDLIFGKGSAKVLLVSFLTSDFFLASAVFLFGWFNDVGGGRFGGIGRVLFELGYFFECRLELRFEVGDFFGLVGNQSAFCVHDAT